jgi:hypothetical protein
MIIVHIGTRWDISRGETVTHKGTAKYLSAIGAEVMSGSAEQVDEHRVNEQGRFYLLGDGERG